MKKEIKERIDKIKIGEVPEGYKPTKIGIIPKEWDVKKCSEIGDFKKGKGISTSDTVESGLPAMMYGDIYVKYDTHFSSVDYRISEETAKYSTDVTKGDLLFTCSGETAEEIGKCVSYQGNETIYIGGDIVAITPESKYNSLYLAYLQNSYPIIKQKAHLGQGHSIVHIYTEHIKTVELPLPELTEQEKIADILLAWDTAIELKEKFIKALDSRKKWIMNKLLSPNSDKLFTIGNAVINKQKWKKQIFQNVLSNITVKNYQIKTDEYISHGKYPVIDQGKKYIVAYCDNKEKLFEVPQNGVIVFGDHTCELKFIDFDFVVGADGTQVLQEKNNNDIKFLYYYLLNNPIQPTGYNRHFSYLKEMVFHLPTLSEQIAIANILSLADIEIKLHKTELEKLKLQKKSLMQLLLTGIVRVS